jgi:hypothetical protein
MDTGAGGCHVCGASERSAIVAATVVAEDTSADAKSAVGRPATPFRQVVDNRWCVLGLLFLVMAVLGLPILWASRAFSRPAKLALTALVIVYTALLAWLCWLAVRAAYHQILDAIRSGGLG